MHTETLKFDMPSFARYKFTENGDCYSNATGLILKRDKWTSGREFYRLIDDEGKRNVVYVLDIADFCKKKLEAQTEKPKKEKNVTDLPAAKPFLKWANNDKVVTEFLKNKVLSTEYVNYHEYFIGNGSLFLSFGDAIGTAYLYDPNPMVLNFWNCLQSKLIKVVTRYKFLVENHTIDTYNQVKANQKTGFHYIDAAQFLYLNQACHGGTWRGNAKGEFNLPANKSDKIKFSSIPEDIHIKLRRLKFSSEQPYKGDIIVYDVPEFPRVESDVKAIFNECLEHDANGVKFIICFDKWKNTIPIIPSNFKVEHIAGGIYETICNF